MLIAIACGLVLTLMLCGVGRRLVVVTAGLLLGIAVSTQFTDLQEAAVHRLDKMLNPSLTLTARTSGRYDLAMAGIHMFRSNPLGVGTGGFAESWRAFDKVPGISSFREGKSTQAHSAWTKTLAENGVPGFALLATYVLSFGAAGIRSRDRERLLFGLLTTAVLALAFVSTESQAKGLWLLVAGVTTVFRGESSLMSRGLRAPGESPYIVGPGPDG